MTVCDEKPVGEVRSSLWRSRWAAVGAAVAVSLGTGGMFVAQAAPGASESTIVSVTITFDAYGVAGPTTDILIDVVGYTTNNGLQEPVADVALKANAAAVAALPGSNILAAGAVRQTGNKAFDTPQLGQFTVSRTAEGRYTLNLTTSCTGTVRFPLVILSLGYSVTTGQIALGTGFCSIATQTATFTVNTSNASGVAADRPCQFAAFGITTQLAGAALLESGELSECEVPAGSGCD